MTAYLEKRKIATRRLFGGNLTRQPAYQEARYRVATPLTYTDAVMDQTFWIGVFPGITPPMMDYTIETFRAFAEAFADVGGLRVHG